MKKFVVAVATVVFFFATNSASAEKKFHPSVVKMLAHGGVDLGKVIRLDAMFVPSGNLVNGFYPSLYLGATLRATKWLDITANAGWLFTPDEPIVSLMLSPYVGKFWAFAELDVYTTSKSGYYFVEAEYKLTDWLHIGAESDGWGNYESGAEWDYGGGPNLLLRFGKIGLDFTVYSRKRGDLAAEEFQTRVHFFL